MHKLCCSKVAPLLRCVQPQKAKLDLALFFQDHVEGKYSHRTLSRVIVFLWMSGGQALLQSHWWRTRADGILFRARSSSAAHTHKQLSKMGNIVRVDGFLLRNQVCPTRCNILGQVWQERAISLFWFTCVSRGSFFLCMCVLLPGSSVKGE